MPTISTLTVDVETNPHKFINGLTLATGALTALGAGAIYAFKQFEDSEKITAQTEAVLTSTGSAAKVTETQILDLASAISQKSGIDDEAIQSGENLLLTFTKIRNETGKGNDIFDRATSIITDMSVALGQDMKSSAIQVGKALQDPILGLTALRRVGVNFNEQQSEMVKKMVESGHQLEAQKFILSELTTEFGGSAEAQATASAKMKVALDNLAETVGGLLAPAFDFLATKLQVAISFLQDNAGPAFKAVAAWLAKMWEGIKPLAEIIGGALVDAWHALVGAVNRLMPDLKKLWEAMKPILIVVGALIAIVLVLAAKLLGPLITAIGVWIDLIVKWNTFLAMIADKIGAFVLKVIGFFAQIPEAVRTILSRVNDWLGGWPGKILGMFADANRLLWDIGKAIIQGLWDGMKSVWHSVTGWLGSIGGWIKDLKGPMSRDRNLLTEQGRAIIGGLQAGMVEGWRGVTSTLGGFNAELSGAAFAAAGGGGGDVVLKVGEETLGRISRNALLKLKGSRSSLGLA